MFTDTIRAVFNDFTSSLNVSLNIKNVINITYGYQHFGIGGGHEYIDKTAWNTTISLPADVNKYRSVVATYYIDCKVDDFFRFYLNSNPIKDYWPGFSKEWAYDLDTNLLWRGQTSFNVNLSKKENSFSIHLISLDYPYYGEIYSSSITITTISN